MTDNEKRFIKSIFSGDSSGHDYYHTIRVYKLATKIAKQENADVKTVQLVRLFQLISGESNDKPQVRKLLFRSFTHIFIEVFWLQSTLLTMCVKSEV